MKLSRKPRKFERVRSPLARVSKNHPCPICGKPDWCSYTEDGSLALCMRESAGSIKRANNNAHIHVLTPNLGNENSATSTPPINNCGNCGNCGSGDTDRRNAVYSYLLGNCLILKPEHGEHLLNERGLGDTVIAAKLYASIPPKSEWELVCHNMRRQFGEVLAGVPGFFKEDGLWKMPRYDGFFIPVRDAEGRIVALQIRGNLDSRYLWFSTPPEKYPHGTSSGAPIHFVKPDLVKQFGHALITEGALKGDIISEYEEEAVIALASATSFDSAEIGSELKRALPELLKVTIAYDADWRENSAVKNALRRLVSALRAAEFDVSVRIWNASLGNGYDNALLAVERAVEHVK